MINKNLLLEKLKMLIKTKDLNIISTFSGK